MRNPAMILIHIGGSLLILYLTLLISDCAKINSPKVLLPWFENLKVNFTLEINGGGCYKWALSRSDIIDLVPIYVSTGVDCSRAARVSVSKKCVPPGSVIILTEEISNGEILRADINISEVSALKIMSTTPIQKLFLEEAPQAFEVVALDDKGNTFSTLEGVSFEWMINNIGDTFEEEPLVTMVRLSDTDYGAPKGVAELEAQGLWSHTVLLYGQTMGDARVTVCLGKICSFFDLKVIASVVLIPVLAYIAQGDSLNYSVVRVRAGELTHEDVGDTLYTLTVPNTRIAKLEDTKSSVRGLELGSTSVYLMSGATKMVSATLSVVRPHSIKLTIRPSDIIAVGEGFTIYCVVIDKDGHHLVAGQNTVIRLTVEGEASINFMRSTENGTITEAMALNSGSFTVTARLRNITAETMSKKVEGEVSALAIHPLSTDPPELFLAWTDNNL